MVGTGMICPALFRPALPRFGDFKPAGDVFDVDDLTDRRQLQDIDDFVDHIAGGAEDEKPFGFDGFDALANRGGVVGLHENGPFNGADFTRLLLGRVSGNNFAVFDEQAVVDDAVDVMVVGDNQRAVAFSGPARTY